MIFNRGSATNDQVAKISEALSAIGELNKTNHYPVAKSRTQATDVDAFSFLLTHRGRLTENQRGKIVQLLMFFGTENAAITIPRVDPNHGKKRTNGIFATPGSNNVHVDSEYEGREAIVIDTPVKLAILEECREDLTKELTTKDWPMYTAKRSGICFDSNLATNMPNYGTLIHAILASCYHGDSFFLHIANLGTRLNIVTKTGTMDVQEGSGSLVDLFQRIKEVRDSGVTVSTLQLDIAFKMELNGANDLIQLAYSKRSNIERNRECIYSNRSTTVYPLHSIDLKKKDHQQRGTLLMKTNFPPKKAHEQLNNRGNNELTADDDSNNPRDRELSEDDGELFPNEENDFHLEDEEILYERMDKIEFNQDLEECYEEETPEDGLFFVAKLLESLEGSGKPGFTMNKNDVFSTKVYNPRQAHPMLQGRIQIKDLLQWHGIQYLPNQNIQKLKKILKDIWTSHLRGAKAVEENGSQIRVEVSIRPEKHSPLRTKGNLLDIILHVYLAIWSLHEQYKISHHRISTSIVQAKVIRLIEHTYDTLRSRDSLVFKDLYKERKYHDWLKCMVSTIMIVSGYAPSHKLKFQKSWYKDSNPEFDPHNLVALMTHKKFFHLSAPIPNHPVPENVPLPQTLAETLQKQLRECGISEDGTHNVLTYCTQCLHLTCSGLYSSKALECFKKLSLPDKMSLVSYLESDIIPGLTSSSNMEQDTVGNEEEGCMNDESHPIHDATLTELEEDLLMVFSNSAIGVNDSSYPMVNDHVIATIRALSMFLKTVNVGNAIPFYTNLFHYIIECHREQNISLPGQGAPLHALNDVAKEILTSQDRPNHKHWKILCRELNVKLNNTTSQRSEEFMRALCLRYCYPCPAVRFSQENTPFDNSSSLNSLLNGILSEDYVKPIQIGRNPNTKIYHRSSESSNVTIIDVTQLVEACVPPSTVVEPSVPPPNSYLHAKYEGDFGRLVYFYLNRHMPRNSTFEQTDFGNNLERGLRKFSKLSSCFLDENGSSYSIFKNVNSVDQLKGTYPTLFSGVNMEPILILPTISLLYERNILFYHLGENRTFLHVSHSPNRIITYTLEGNNWEPQIKVDIFYQHKDMFCECQTESHVQDYRTLFSILTTPVRTIQNGVQYFTHTQHKELNQHPWFVATRARCESKFLQAAKKAIETVVDPNTISHRHDHFGLNQVLEHPDVIGGDEFTLILNTYINELTQHHENFDEVMNLLFTDSLRDELVDENVALPLDTSALGHKILCPFLCLKHKVTIVVWTKKRSEQKRTSIYFYNVLKKQVDVQFSLKYLFITNAPRVCYLRYNGKKYGYYQPQQHPPVDHLCTKYMTSPYSFIHDQFLFDCLNKIWDQIRTMGPDMMENPFVMKPISHPIVPGNNPILLPKKLCTPENYLTGWFLISVFPLNRINKWTICATYFSTYLSETVKLQTNCFKQQVVQSQAPTSGNYEDDYVIRYYCPEEDGIWTPKLDCESGFLTLISAFVCSRCSTIDQYIKTMDNVMQEEDLLPKSRVWAVRMLEQPHQTVPQWLRDKISST